MPGPTRPRVSHWHWRWDWTWSLFARRRPRPRPKPGRATKFHFTFGPIDDPPAEDPSPMADNPKLILKPRQRALITVAPADAAGNPAAIDGVVTWTSTDPAIIAVQPAPDGFSCFVAAAGKLGNAQVTCSADADLDPVAVSEIRGLLDVMVVAGPAVGFALTVGTPEDIPAEVTDTGAGGATPEPTPPA